MKILTTRRGLLAPLFLSLLFAGPALAETQMLTAAGMTGTTTGVSTCPTPATSSCSSGWFRIEGAGKAYVQVESSSTSSATVKIEGKTGASASTQLLKTIANPALGDVAYVIEGMGWVRITVSIHASGTILANLTAYSPSGGKLW